MDHRIALGQLGEKIAALVLVGRGVVIIDRNVEVGKGEIDLIVRTGRQRAVVEVRTVRGDLRLEERFPYAKRRHVRSLAGRVGIHRVDLVAVAIKPFGLEVHWLRDVPTD